MLGVEDGSIAFRLVFLSKIDNVGSGGRFDLCSLCRRGEDTDTL